MSLLKLAEENFKIIKDPHDKYVINKMKLSKLDNDEDYNVNQI